MADLYNNLINDAFDALQKAKQSSKKQTVILELKNARSFMNAACLDTEFISDVIFDLEKSKGRLTQTQKNIIQKIKV